VFGLVSPTLAGEEQVNIVRTKWGEVRVTLGEASDEGGISRHGIRFNGR